jgi:hypothetical protein
VTYRFPGILAASFLLAGFPTHAAAQSTSVQSKSEKDLQAVGSRVGDLGQDPNNTGLTGNRRINNRINSRLDSRLNTRQERFYVASQDDRQAYTPKADDGTKGKARAGYGRKAKTGYGSSASAGYGSDASVGYGNDASAGYGNNIGAGYGNNAGAGTTPSAGKRSRNRR